MVCKSYCEICKLPLSSDCTEHRKHKIKNIITSYTCKTKTTSQHVNGYNQVLYARRIVLEDKQMTIKRHLAKHYEHRYEQSAKYPVQCFAEEWKAPWDIPLFQ